MFENQISVTKRKLVARSDICHSCCCSI